MNLRTFADSLTMTEVNELSNILWEVKKQYARSFIKPLDDFELACVAEKKHIEAIKHYRTRVGSSLLEAKLAVDVHMGR